MHSDLCIYIRTDLVNGCKEANRNVKDAKLLPQMFDTKEWLKPCMLHLNKHSNPHIFRLVCSADGHCSMYYKQWHHDEWWPRDGPGVHLLKVQFK